MKHAFVYTIVWVIFSQQLLWRFMLAAVAIGSKTWRDVTSRVHCDDRGSIHFSHQGTRVNFYLNKRAEAVQAASLVPVFHRREFCFSRVGALCVFDMRMVQQDTEHREPEFHLRLES